MARPNHYVPSVTKSIVCALYHEARYRGIPMTRLVEHLLSDSLRGTPGWQKASQEWPELTAHQEQDQHLR